MASSDKIDHKAKLDQIIGEAFVKSTHIVLASRVVGAGRKPSNSASKAWVRYGVVVSGVVVYTVCYHPPHVYVATHSVQYGCGGGRGSTTCTGAMAPRYLQTPGHPDFPPTQFPTTHLILTLCHSHHQKARCVDKLLYPFCT